MNSGYSKLKYNNLIKFMNDLIADGFDYAYYDSIWDAINSESEEMVSFYKSRHNQYCNFLVSKNGASGFMSIDYDSNIDFTDTRKFVSLHTVLKIILVELAIKEQINPYSLLEI